MNELVGTIGLLERGIAEGLPEQFKDKTVPKFRDGGFNIVRAGGSAGMFSAIIAGWGASAVFRLAQR